MKSSDSINTAKLTDKNHTIKITIKMIFICKNPLF